MEIAAKRARVRSRPASLLNSHLNKMVLAALGVVYGDIGTSPLYALRDAFHGPHSVAMTPENLIGILSCFIWTLILVVSVKYLTFVLQADNSGEGGTMAQMALLAPKVQRGAGEKFKHGTYILLGVFGCSLLYGDGIITPAISVLSAVEGLEVATPVFNRFIVPITVVILIALFSAQKRGTQKMGTLFGPATLLWFVTLSALGVSWIIQQPGILRALDPRHAAQFFSTNGLSGFLVLGSVVLCVTGAEALYADMGHFGAKPIRIAWYLVVLPSLILNYLGQGAYLLSLSPEAALGAHPFYGMVPGPLLYPVVIIATLATIIASQALISGAFSLTYQAVQLGYLPRVPVVHTSEVTEGQIYIARVNQFLMIACVALVLSFQNSTNLAAAYGVAVTANMTITSILFFAVATKIWNWSVWRAAALVGLFLVLDLSFLSANLAKVLHGGWVPLAIGLLLYTLMVTWRRGRAILSDRIISRGKPLQEFLNEIGRTPPLRVRGTAVFMTPNTSIAPGVLLHHFRHNKVLHERVVLLTVQTRHVPTMAFHEHARVTSLEHGFYQVIACYGYMQQPNISEILACSQLPELKPDREDLSFYLGRETLLTGGTARIARWRKALFSILTRNAQPATAFFEIPPEKVIEVGFQVEL